MALTLAITGGTGFVGGHTLDEAARQGQRVRALARSAQPAREGVTWVQGSLTDPAALCDLVRGADAVIHIAGVTNARTPADFVAGNVLGTAFVRLAAGPLPLVHVSSLSARAPQLSHYGRSKLQGEQVALGAAGPVAVVRPPAVYGPGDREFLALFRTARSGYLPLPANARAAMLYGTDLAAALVALGLDLAGPARSAGSIFEIDDGTGGYAQPEIAAAIAAAIGRAVRPVELPAALIKLAAVADTAMSLALGRQPQLSRDRAGYMVHRDWTANSAPLRALGIWEPHTRLAQGMADTARWYRAQGLL